MELKGKVAPRLAHGRSLAIAFPITKAFLETSLQLRSIRVSGGENPRLMKLKRPMSKKAASLRFRRYPSLKGAGDRPFPKPSGGHREIPGPPPKKDLLPMHPLPHYNDDLILEHYASSPRTHLDGQRRGIVDDHPEADSSEELVKAACTSPFFVAQEIQPRIETLNALNFPPKGPPAIFLGSGQANIPTWPPWFSTPSCGKYMAGPNPRRHPPHRQSASMRRRFFA